MLAGNRSHIYCVGSGAVHLRFDKVQHRGFPACAGCVIPKWPALDSVPDDNAEG